MSNPIIAVQTSFPLGTTLKIYLTSGQVVEGELIELTIGYLKVRSTHGDVLVFASLLGGVEAVVPGAKAPGQLAPRHPSTEVDGYAPSVTEVPMFEAAQAVAPKVSGTPEVSQSISSVQRALDIAARVRRAIASAQPECMPPITRPDDNRLLDLGLTLPQKAELIGEFDRCYQLWGHGKNVADVTHANALLGGMQGLLRLYPRLWEAHYNLGCYFMQMENPKAATAEFIDAAVTSENFSAWHNAGIAAFHRQQRAIAQIALGRCFCMESPRFHVDSWRVFVQLMTESRVYDLLPVFYEYALKEKAAVTAEMIWEATVFVAVEEGHSERVDRVLEDPTSRFPARQAVHDALGNLGERQMVVPQELKDLINKAKARPLAPLRANEEGLVARPGRGPQAPPTAYYSQAHQAWVRDKDLDKAEMLFRLAIRTEDTFSSAVKDLASLLQQRGRHDEAQDVLVQHGPNVSDHLSIANLQGSIEFHRSNYATAIPYLKKAVELSPAYRRATALKNLANACYRAQRFDEAENHARAALAISSNDPKIRLLLENTLIAKKSGRIGAVVEFEEDVVERGGRSAFLDAQLEACDYLNVPQKKVSERTFTMEDVRKLKGIIEGAGSKRFRERAGTHLARARMMLDLQQAEPSEVEVELRQYCGFMGDLSLQSDLPIDVARAFYSEAFGVSLSWTDPPGFKMRQGLEWNGNRRLTQLLMLLYAPKNDILDDTLPTLVKALEHCLTTPQIRQKTTEGLLRLSLANGNIRVRILESVKDHPRLNQLLRQSLSDYAGISFAPTATCEQLWEPARRHFSERWQRAQAQLAVLLQLAGNIESTSTQVSTIRELKKTELKDGLDSSRLDDLLGLLEQISDYSQEALYIERERLHDLIDQRVQALLINHRDRPTTISIEVFKPYLEKLRETLLAHFARVQEAAEPDRLETSLLIQSYTPDPATGRIDCQIEIRNPAGKSPASNVVLEVLPSRDGDYQVPQAVEESSLQGGARRTVTVPLQLTSRGLKSELVALAWRVRFTSRMKKHFDVDSQSDSIRLYAADRFETFYNPYSGLVGKIAVDDRYFFGRSDIIARFRDAINNSPDGKSHILYGQKRAGKSSILYHLQKQFTAPFIPISFNIYSVGTEFKLPVLLYKIASAIDQDIGRRTPNGRSPLPCPTLADMRAGEIIFEEYLRAALDYYQNNLFSGLRARLILLLDEFSHLYSLIKRKDIPADFMKYWKALVEQGYFSAVLVGQDTMPYFISLFPNEFQLGLHERINYLEETPALQLIEEPIMIRSAEGIPLESRFKGPAAQRVFEYTAGSPYFTQIFCNHLVQYMHERRAPFVADPDIDRVKDLLVRGDRCLRKEDFDALLTTGDANMNIYDPEKVVEVLGKIAAQTRRDSYSNCDRSQITAPGISTLETDDILQDLLKRDVLQEQGKGKFRIRVGLFKEWLNANA